MKENATLLILILIGSILFFSSSSDSTQKDSFEISNSEVENSKELAIQENGRIDITHIFSKDNYPNLLIVEFLLDNFINIS